MIKRSEKFASEDKKIKDRADVKNELESCSYSLKIQLNDKEKLDGKLSSDDKTTIETAVEGQIKWLESNPDADVDELKQHKKELERIVIPIIANLYGEDDPNFIDPNLNALV
ncbi:unnamed protein product [Rotaria sp. Silwood1]|nr:unnamed protein product [Rotaria sp. Silwood1]